MNTNTQQLISAESVSEGHPDKIADQISDTVLDIVLAKDHEAKVACEALVKSEFIVIAGEIFSKYKLSEFDFETAIRQIISKIGYSNTPIFNSKNCQIRQIITNQSPEIHNAIKTTSQHDQGAGDQGVAIGFACDETTALMPTAIYYAHQLMQRQAKLRKTLKLPWLLPDAKCLVSVKYDGYSPVNINNIMFSTQHLPEINYKKIKEAVIEEIILPVIPKQYLDNNSKLIVNSSKMFCSGGPVVDCGMTGRKIMVDTYGCGVPHGGGAFSGKDPSKVDRSGALMARFIAKNIVAAKLASRVMVQICYAIGWAEPIAIDINTFGTSKISKERLIAIIHDNFDLRPAKIIDQLDLLRPIYTKTAAYGHFGRSDPDFSWEQTINVQR